jgi:predicted DNA-binding transcriptional regulator AlpA
MVYYGAQSCIMDMPNDFIKVSEAQHILGVSHKKMTQLLRDGVLRYFPNPLDKRQKLLSKADVVALIPQRAEAA